MAVHITRAGSGDESEGGENNPFQGMFGPQHVDTLIRQSVQFCWMSIPKSRRTPDELERQIRRLLDRALEDFREDQTAFGEEPQ
jgi:hypothetical protein